MSFSQEFNDLIEHKRGIKEDVFDQNYDESSKAKKNNAMEQVRQSRLGRPSLLQKIDEYDEDDFFDAVGDQETL